MSVIHKSKGRMRSASSPGKVFIFAPAADSLPVVAQSTPEQAVNDDGSVESFSKGIDRLNIEYKKSLLVKRLLLICSLNLLELEIKL
jgi:hypothetical protein